MNCFKIQFTDNQPTKLKREKPTLFKVGFSEIQGIIW